MYTVWHKAEGITVASRTHRIQGLGCDYPRANDVEGIDQKNMGTRQYVEKIVVGGGQEVGLSI